MTTGHEPIGILTVDDRARLRKGVRALIGAESDMQLVAEACTCFVRFISGEEIRRWSCVAVRSWLDQRTAEITVKDAIEIT